MKFGANTFIFSSPFSTSEHLYLVDKLKQMGLDLIEVAVEDPALVDLAALKEALAAAEMGVVGGCGWFGLAWVVAGRGWRVVGWRGWVRVV